MSQWHLEVLKAKLLQDIEQGSDITEGVKHAITRIDQMLASMVEAETLPKEIVEKKTRLNSLLSLCINNSEVNHKIATLTNEIRAKGYGVVIENNKVKIL